MILFAGIEDLMNWHGKPLGAKAEEVISSIEGQMKSSGPYTLRPQPITATVPKADITNIRLSEPPKYELGQQVNHRMLNM